MVENDDGLSAVLANASRAARQSLNQSEMEELVKAATKARELADRIGFPGGIFSPQLDMQTASVSKGSIAMHLNDIPVKRLGLGSRRLLSIALQQYIHAGKTISLIDEIEHGLEPHRVARALKCVVDNESGQAILTTHSPVVLRELSLEDMFIVHSNEGVTSVTSLSSGLEEKEAKKLQANLRSNAESFLARRLIVCEGATEVGLCREIDQYWCDQSKPPFAYFGTSFIDGGGSSAPELALRLQSLGYETCLFCDSDRDISPSEDVLKGSGVFIVQWTNKRSFEEVLFEEASKSLIISLLESLAEERSKQYLVASMERQNGAYSSLSGEDIADWKIDELFREAAVQAALKGTKNGGAWLKSISYGMLAGRSIMEEFDHQKGNELHEKVISLSNWVGIPHDVS